MALTFLYNSNVNFQNLFVDVRDRFGANLKNIWLNGSQTQITFSNSLTSTEQGVLSHIAYVRGLKDNNLIDQISTSNTTTTLLSGNNTFNGGIDNIFDFSFVEISVYADKPSASNGIQCIMYANSNLLGGSNVSTFSYAGNSNSTFIVNVSNSFPFNNVRYTNSASAQSNFSLQTRYIKQYFKKNDIVTINDKITDSEQCILTKSIIVGNYNNDYYPVSVNNENKLGVDVPKSVFGLLKTTTDVPIIQVEFNYELSSQFVNTSSNALGSVTSANSLAIVSSGSSANSFGLLRTVRFIKYKPGQGINCMFTGLFDVGVAGNTQIIGPGNSLYGYYFGYTGSNFGVMRRNQGIDEWILQDNWNLDKMDGYGPSRVVLNKQLGNVYRITYQWLGFGQILYMIENPSTGEFVPVHRNQYANKNSVPSTFVPSFPMMVQSINTTNTTNIQTKTACLNAMCEGIQSTLGLTFGIDNTKTISTLTNLMVISIRSKTTFKGQDNVIPVYLKLLSLSADGTRNAIIYLFKDTVLGGAPLVWTDVSTDSVMEYNTNGTTITGGTQIAAFSMGKVESRTFSVADLNYFIAPGSVITIAARLLVSGTNDISASLTWYEDR